MSERLEVYRRLRDFALTPEPAGTPVGETPAADDRRFVVQQHDATRLHWDLRLEHDGVLLSFALPRGVPWTPDENRLAVHTEDHPLEYLTFHGEIPAGEYGAGRMVIWDRGTYEAHKIRDDELIVTLHGQRITGRYALFPLQGRDWMIHRMDPPQDPERRPLPGDLRPMAAVPGALPSDDGWAFEIWWSGQRVLATNDAGRLTLVTGAGRDVSGGFPEVRRLGRALAAVEVVLDGVLVPVDRDGRPGRDDGRLDRRVAAVDDSRSRRLAEDQPVALVAVDLLWLEGHPTTGLPYEDRRRLLAELDLQGPAWQAPGHHVGDGQHLLAAAGAQGLRGLVAKRTDSPYRPGEASDDWRLVEATA